MLNSELERSRYLKQKLEGRGIRFDEFLDENYRALIVHSNSTIVIANDEAGELLGYVTKELEGMNAWNLFPPHSVGVVTQNLLNKSEQPYRVDARRKDGSLVHVELCGINFEITGEPLRAVMAKAVHPDTAG